jgi:hypothetical protein
MMLTRPGPKKSEIESAQREPDEPRGGFSLDYYFFYSRQILGVFATRFVLESPRSAENYSWASYVVDICLAIKRAMSKRS